MTLEVDKILRILPHRPPLLMLDRVVKLDPWRSATGIKCVTFNEPIFAGQIWDTPALPPSLCLEAMTQLMCVLAFASNAAPPERHTFMLAGAERVKFRQPIVPGDVLQVAVEVLQHRSNIWKCQCTAHVGEQLCAEAELLAAVQGHDG